MGQPLLTIITINYNNKNGLIRTVSSVIAQTVVDYEYILIDGGSTDGSIDIICQYKNKFAFWVSEKDNGIYDALNKGIQKANGKYLLFLNSGDCFVNANVLAKVWDAISKNEYDIVYGNSVFREVNTIRHNPHPLSLFKVLTFGISHQSFFFKKELFEKAGLYDTRYKIIADSCHLMICLVKHNATNLYIDMPISETELDGVSIGPVIENRKDQVLFMRTEFPALDDDYKLLRQYSTKDYTTRIKKFLLRKLKGTPKFKDN